MPKSMIYKKPSSIKRKYHEKVLSDDGVYTTWIRNLQVSEIFAEYVWLQFSVFDLNQLGLGLVHSILPIEYEPLIVNFEFETPSTEETLQGIWAKFKPVRYDLMYKWMTDFRYYVLENIKEEFQSTLLQMMPEKAKYGVTRYGMGIYDPVVVREFLRATFHKLRLLRKPDVSWLDTMRQVVETLDLTRVTDKHIFNRMSLLFSAQTNAFVLGLSLLGKAKLTETKDGWGVIPMIDADGNLLEVKFRTLDHLQMGFILGITPLGMGFLMPKESIYKLKDGKKNPPIIDFVSKKIKDIISRLSLSTWSYSNYNKPEEMADYHKSDRTTQYDLLQTQRRFIEEWVRARIPADEANPVKIRQYQNAVLQLVAWKAKRHRWGFGGWKAMTEDEFKSWWLEHWSSQGLKREVLERLYEGAKIWLSHIRDQKIRLGEKIKRSRLRLAMSI